MKKQYVIIIALLFTIESIVGCSSQKSSMKSYIDTSDEYVQACNSPFGKYPETITYTLGKMSAENNSNLPDGDSYENNAYTRFLFDRLNVQNKDIFEAVDNNYNNTVTLSIASRNIPDVMLVNDYSTLKVLVENDMIEDLSDVYEKCTSDRIKDIYNSYGDEILNNVTFDGKLMALPETNIDNGPNMLWIRKDWLDSLNLELPTTLDDVENILHQFIDKDPGNNGPGNTIGLACASELVSYKGYSYNAQADIIFSNFNSYPKKWIKDSENEISYGSVLPEAKTALSYMNKLYKDGLLDNKFLIRTQTNIQEIINNGTCGAFFGYWWAPNNPLIESYKNNEDAEWVPCIISTDKDGNTSFASQQPSNKYIVVRKGYEHPEIVMKITSVLFDYFNYNSNGVDEIKQYYANNVDPTARPFSINTDYKDALVRSYRKIRNALDKKIKPDKLQLIEYSYYEQSLKYLSNVTNSTPEDWAAYNSRITACSLLESDKTKTVPTYFHNKETETMTNVWWKLQELEKQTYLKIITGEEDINYFDKFVDEWYKQGGKTITEEVRKYEAENNGGN